MDVRSAAKQAFRSVAKMSRLGAFLALSGCVSADSPTNKLEFVGIHLVEADGRQMLRADFLSVTDLREVADRGAYIFLHDSFCSHGDDFAVLSGSTVYLNDQPLRPGADRSTGDPVYSFLINVIRKQNLDAKPIQHSFDLRSAPEDICFYVTGKGFFGLIFKSAVATIPASSITGVFKQIAVTKRELLSRPR